MMTATPQHTEGQRKCRPFSRSHLFNLQSTETLASFLYQELSALEQLVMLPVADRYLIRPQTQGTKVRWVQVPRAVLKRVHRRIFCILNQIVTPDYLHSGKRGCSYITNATPHIGAKSIFKVDISRFFESVLWKNVYNLFRHQMKCSPHVSGLLADICTVERQGFPVNNPELRDRHLPTGSPISQCLAYWSFARMFDAIAHFADARGLNLTVYVDDITLSSKSKKISVATQRAVKSIVERYGLGLSPNKARIYGSRAYVTGTIITAVGLRLPNFRRQQILLGVSRLKRVRRLRQRVTYLRKLVGQLWSATELDPKLRRRAEEHQEYLNAIYQKHPECRPRSIRKKQGIFGCAASKGLKRLTRIRASAVVVASRAA